MPSVQELENQIAELQKQRKPRYGMKETRIVSRQGNVQEARIYCADAERILGGRKKQKEEVKITLVD